MSASTEKWMLLTWDDLEAWAGSRSVSRGRSYQRGGRVKDLVISKDGQLLAYVSGGERYITSVVLTRSKKKANSLQSKCTCPVGADGCKHAVAVVAEYLEQRAVDSEIPIAGNGDPRWARLDSQALEEDDWDGGADDEFEDDSEEPASRPTRRSRTDWDERIRKHIESKSREDLVELVWSLTERFSELRDEFRERIALGEGDVDRLVSEARKELRRVTSETGWRNNWSGEGHTPDFSKLKHRLERMAELGHPDAVVKLGMEIIERGMELVEQSHDEGETGMELATCMPAIFGAVGQSTLPPAKKLLFIIDASLTDEFDIIGSVSDIVVEKEITCEEWSKVADELAQRLKSKSVPVDEEESYSRDYRRDQISGWLVRALEKAGREGEIVAVYESEARKTASYERLVLRLIALKRYDDAERWAREGIERTIEKLPGIASALGKALGELAKSRRKWEIAAAHAAWEFFDSAGVESFNQLITAASKAKCEQQVRTAAVKFLESGQSPIHMATGTKDAGKARVDASWPLPVPDYLMPLLKSARRHGGPHYDVLIDMAIAEKRHDDVLRWYDRLCADKKHGSSFSWYSRDCGDQVAEAVAKTHPNRSLEIYRARVNACLGSASRSAYETVAAYLKKMRPILKSLAREKELNLLVGDLRQRFRNRPRFVEILDTVEGKTILQSERDRL
jgi:uncharacterized Zn finger protein